MTFSKKLKDLAELYLVFFKIGAITFGGGLAMLPILERELVNKKQWLTKERLLDYFAIGQVTPGIVAVNVATFLGYSRCGILGGIAATTAVVTPSIIVISVIARFLAGFSDIPVVKKALAGINIAVSALLCKVLWSFRKHITSSLLAALLFAAALISVIGFHVNTVLVIAVSIIAGFALFAWEHFKKK